MRWLPHPFPANPFFFPYLPFPSHPSLPLEFKSQIPHPEEGAGMGSSFSSPSLIPSPFPCSPPHPGFSPGPFQGGIPGSGCLIPRDVGTNPVLLLLHSHFSPPPALSTPPVLRGSSIPVSSGPAAPVGLGRDVPELFFRDEGDFPRIREPQEPEIRIRVTRAGCGRRQSRGSSLNLGLSESDPASAEVR